MVIISNPFYRTVLRTHKGLFGLIAIFVIVPTRTLKRMRANLSQQLKEDVTFLSGEIWGSKTLDL